MKAPERRESGHRGAPASEPMTVAELVADLPAGFRMTELGPLPEEWELVQLGDVVLRAFGGGTP